MPSASSQKQIPLSHRVMSTQTHSTAQGGMHHDEPIAHNHHQQRLQGLAPPPQQVVAPMLWPHQTANYWFPNWRELFHGFTVIQGDAQPTQATASSLERNCGVERAQECGRRSHSPIHSTQSLQRTAEPSRSSHHSATVSTHQQLRSPFPSPATYPPPASISAHPQQVSSPLASPAGPLLPQSRPNPVAQMPLPSSLMSHDAAQASGTLPRLDSIDLVRKEDALTACPPCSRAPGLISDKGPFWLPQGWATEIRMRGTGTVAEKVYKHIASGRRFRSRSDVLHFISTGKRRSKKKGRCKKSLTVGAGHSITDTFAHQKRTAFSASELCTQKLCTQSLLPAFSGNRHPTHVGMTPLLTGPQVEMRRECENGPPSKRSISSSTTGIIQGPDSLPQQWKQPAQQKPQKLPVKKKAKITPPKHGADRQASRLWESFKHSGVEKQAPEMTDPKYSNGLGLKETSSQRTVQLGRDLQAAHRTVVLMSKEMQATVEKLSREIEEAQKDMRSGDHGKLPLTAETQVGSINITETTKPIRDTKAASGPSMMAGTVVQVHRPTDNLSPQAQWPHPGVAYVSHAIQTPIGMPSILKQGGMKLDVSSQATDSTLNDRTHRSSSSISHATRPPSPISHVTQPAIWPIIPFHQGIHLEKVTCASEAAKRHLAMASSMTPLTGTASATTINATLATPSPMLAQISLQQSMEETADSITRPAMWPGFLTVNVAQTTDTPAIDKGRDTKAAQSCGLSDCHAPTPEQPAKAAHTALSIRTPSPGARNVVMSSQSTQSAQEGGVAQANVTQAAHQRQISVECNFPPATGGSARSMSNATAPAQNPDITEDVVPVHAGGRPSSPLNAAQTSDSSETWTGMEGAQEEIGRQKYQDRRAGRLRRRKFAAVLNPKLDLSRLNPALTARQRAKAVQRLKSRHARQLLAALGLHLCRRAVRGSVSWTR